MQQQRQQCQNSLSQPAYLLLASLVHGPKHAVALREAIEQREGAFIEPGTLYRVLAHLERRGWIEGFDEQEPLRRYRLTALGILTLEQAEVGSHREKPREGGSPGLRKGKEIIMHLVLWILHLYPPAWRERYEREMAALLEQHEITLWTVLDLLMGALDARLDPNYRRAHQLLPLRRFKSSWRLLVAGFVAFWMALLPWFWMSVLGIDDADCSTWGANYALCVMRKMVNAHQPALPTLLVALILIFLPILLLLFMTTLTRAHGRKARTHLLLAAGATVGMLVLCIACGIWLGGIWQLFPQIGQFYPLTPTGLVIGIVGMGLATALAVGSLLRAALALKELAVGKATPREEPFTPAPEQQEMPMVLRAAADTIHRSLHREEPAARGHDTSVPTGESRKISKGEWALLIGLVLLYIFPWPGLISGDRPDFSTLLSTWLVAGIVGVVAAWLVKEPRAQVARKPQRATSPMVWAAVLPMPLLVLSFRTITSFNFSLQDILYPLSFFLCAAFVSGMTALIVKIRMRSPRFINPKVLGTCAFILMTWLILTIVSQGTHIGFGGFIMPLLLAAVSITPAFFVRVRGGKQQGEGASEPRDIGAGAGPKVWGWFLFLLSCNYVFARIGLLIFTSLSPQGPPRMWIAPPMWIGPNEELLATLAAICLIPAVIAKVRISNLWAQGAREPGRDELSPKIWILVLPIVFLSFCTQMAHIIGPDSSNFGDVFIVWALTGLAVLIMLLAMRLGSRKRMAPPMEQARIHIEERQNPIGQPGAR